MIKWHLQNNFTLVQSQYAVKFNLSLTIKYYFFILNSCEGSASIIFKDSRALKDPGINPGPGSLNQPENTELRRYGGFNFL